jgi:hypothetical protein
MIGVVRGDHYAVPPGLNATVQLGSAYAVTRKTHRKTGGGRPYAGRHDHDGGSSQYGRDRAVVVGAAA